MTPTGLASLASRLGGALRSVLFVLHDESPDVQYDLHDRRVDGAVGAGELIPRTATTVVGNSP